MTDLESSSPMRDLQLERVLTRYLAQVDLADIQEADLFTCTDKLSNWLSRQTTTDDMRRVSSHWDKHRFELATQRRDMRALLDLRKAAFAARRSCE